MQSPNSSGDISPCELSLVTPLELGCASIFPVFGSKTVSCQSAIRIEGSDSDWNQGNTGTVPRRKKPNKEYMKKHLTKVLALALACCGFSVAAQMSPPVRGVNGRVNAIAYNKSSGTFYVGGEFTQAGDQMAYGIA